MNEYLSNWSQQLKRTKQKQNKHNNNWSQQLKRAKQTTKQTQQYLNKWAGTSPNANTNTIVGEISPNFVTFTDIFSALCDITWRHNKKNGSKTQTSTQWPQQVKTTDVQDKDQRGPQRVQGACRNFWESSLGSKRKHWCNHVQKSTQCRREATTPCGI